MENKNTMKPTVKQGTQLYGNILIHYIIIHRYYSHLPVKGSCRIKTICDWIQALFLASFVVPSVFCLILCLYETSAISLACLFLLQERFILVFSSLPK